MNLPVGFVLDSPTPGPQASPYRDAIAGIESAGSGDYSALGPVTRKGDRAYGRYQVMGSNIGPWTEKYLGRRLTPEEFLADQQAQDRVFDGEFGSYVQKYGPSGASRAWFAGEGGMDKSNRKDSLGTSVAEYERKFTGNLGNPQPQQARNVMGGTDMPMGAMGAPQLPPGFQLDTQPAGDFRLENKMPLPKQEETPVNLAGMGKSFASGAQKGLVGMAGLPGDVRQYAAKAIEGATGIDLPQMPSWIPSHVAGLPTGARTSEQLQSGLEGAGMPVHEPQNTAEEYAATAGSFLPAVVAGPVNAARTGIGRAGEALTRSVGLGTAVETAGRAAGAINPALEAPAQFAAAILAGGPSAVLKQRSVVRSTDDWKAVADGAYKLLDDLQAGLSPQATHRMLMDVATRLSKQNFDEKYHTSAYALLERMARMVAGGRPIRFPELQNLRTEAGSLFGSNDPSSRFVRTFKDAIDDAWAKAKPSDMAGKNLNPAQLREAQKAAVTAKEAYFMQKKGEMLDQMAARINSRAENFSVSGLENAVKTEARQIITKISRNTPAGKKLRSMFTKAQLKRVERMAEGKGIGEIVKIAKKYGPSNSIATSNFAIGGMITSAIMGDITPLLIGGTMSGVGAAAKAIGNRRAKTKWDAFTDNMRGGQDPRTTFNPTAPLLYGAQARPALPGSGQ